MNDPCDTCPGMGVCDVDCRKKVAYENSGTAPKPKPILTSIERDITKLKQPEPAPGFDEIFAAYDDWYYGKFRNHPEKMAADAFFQFLKKSNLIKETV